MLRRAAARAHQQFTFLVRVVLLLWGVEIVNLLIFQQGLVRFGIQPRTLHGLIGIPLAPLLHGSVAHLLANTGPLLVLGWIVLLRGVERFWEVTLFTALASGVGVWLIGSSDSVHVGASGVIFGYVGYLLLRAWYERSFSAITTALLVGVLYGGVVWGVLPGQRGVSWEAHLCGFLGGCWLAKLQGSR